MCATCARMIPHQNIAHHVKDAQILINIPVAIPKLLCYNIFIHKHKYSRKDTIIMRDYYLLLEDIKACTTRPQLNGVWFTVEQYYRQGRITSEEFKALAQAKRKMAEGGKA